jgi:hypothetical protein
MKSIHGATAGGENLRTRYEFIEIDAEALKRLSGWDMQGEQACWSKR